MAFDTETAKQDIRITIKDSQTDKPIKELTTATIDFTIFDN